MAGAPSPLQRQQTVQRDFEFSRLHEEWMASAYALVVPERCNRQQQPTPSDAGQPGHRLRQARQRQTERNAG